MRERENYREKERGLFRILIQLNSYLRIILNLIEKPEQRLLLWNGGEEEEQRRRKKKLAEDQSLKKKKLEKIKKSLDEGEGDEERCSNNRCVWAMDCVYVTIFSFCLINFPVVGVSGGRGKGGSRCFWVGNLLL